MPVASLVFVSPEPGIFSGRALEDPGFAGDTGAAPVELAEALESGSPADLVAALLATRVLVAVVALADEDSDGPGARDGRKEADMAVVTVRAASGRLGLPAFSSIQALAAWSQDARPVPVAGVLAARAAYDEGATALLVDPAGPARRVVEGPDLLALAEARRSDRPLEDPQLTAAVARAAATVGLTPEHLVLGQGVTDPSVDRGDVGSVGADVVVRLIVGEPFDDAAAREVGRAFGQALGADPAMQGRLAHGVDVSVERGT
jgi:SseB protein N-terminal domain